MNEEIVMTKEEKIKKLFKVLNVLRNDLRYERMVVGGSMAMYVHGFNVEPHDLDIEIEGADRETLVALNMMERVNRDMKNNSLSEYPEDLVLRRIKVDDVEVDIWVVDKIDYNRVVTCNGVEFGDVLSVLKKKMAMDREKDYKTLVDYVNQITYFTR